MKIMFYQSLLLCIAVISAQPVYLNLQPVSVVEGSSLTLDCHQTNGQRGSTSTYYRDSQPVLVVEPRSGNDCNGEWKVNHTDTEIECFGVFRLRFQHITRELNSTTWQCEVDGQRSSNRPMINVIGNSADNQENGTTDQNPTALTQPTPGEVTIDNTATTNRSPTSKTQLTPGEVTCDHTASTVLIGIFAGGFVLLAVINIVVLIWRRNKKKTKKRVRRMEDGQSANVNAETQFIAPELNNSNRQPRPDSHAHLPRAPEGGTETEVTAPDGHYSTLQADAMDYEHMYGAIAEDGSKHGTTRGQGEPDGAYYNCDFRKSGQADVNTNA